jgi:hypothetical protein
MTPQPVSNASTFALLRHTHRRKRGNELWNQDTTVGRSADGLGAGAEGAPGGAAADTEFAWI